VRDGENSSPLAEDMAAGLGVAAGETAAGVPWVLQLLLIRGHRLSSRWSVSAAFPPEAAVPGMFSPGWIQPPVTGNLLVVVRITAGSGA
jgi:hypothetical protein